MLPVGTLVGAGFVGVLLGLVGERVGARLGSFFVGALVLVQAPQETSTLQRHRSMHQQRPTLIHMCIQQLTLSSAD